jgi:hypothetical protein
MKRLTSMGLTEYDRTRGGSAPVPTPKYRGDRGGIAPTTIHGWIKQQICRVSGDIYGYFRAIQIGDRYDSKQNLDVLAWRETF